MSNRKGSIENFLYINLLSWLLLLVINFAFFFGLGTKWLLDIDKYLKGLILNVIFLFVFFFIEYGSKKLKELSSTELLRRGFKTGLTMVIVSLLLQIVFLILNDTYFFALDIKYHIFYNINILLICIFITKILFYFKIVIFKKISQNVINIWNVFSYALLVSLFFNFFDFTLKDLPFKIAFSIVLGVCLVLSVNMRWVAYLSTKEKWQNAVRLLMIIIFCLYFLSIMQIYDDKGGLQADLMSSLYVLAIFTFILVYATFSILVLIFNIPTTGIFEKKLEEVLSFQNLTQSLQIGKSENDLYIALLESAFKAVAADAGWIEIANYYTYPKIIMHKGISVTDIEKIKADIRIKKLKKLVYKTFSKNISKKLLPNHMRDLGHEEIMVHHLILRDVKLGSLFLIKNISDSFDQEKKDLITTFTKQTSIAVENIRLLSRTIENERLKQELEIAQKIQKSLLPSNLNVSPGFQVAAFSNSAYEVGGDYYDIYQINADRTLIIVGDVSGKGTSAAFHMAQLKGIFQSLAQLDFSPDQFLSYANEALSRCLDKASFVTVTVLLIDTQKQKIKFSRAGHCPILYFCAERHVANYISDKGMGLGIIRSKHYSNFLELNEMSYDAGDMIMLYTDGITETKNEQAEEFGYERLQQLLTEKSSLNVEEIHDDLIKNLHEFCRGVAPEDDYTSVLIRFT